ncbi:MAG: arsenate reductase ArsC [Alphaproteobacteria bacterium]|nr:arsenate reductase ArsC [Alphaproteobacteria bacterium]
MIRNVLFLCTGNSARSILAEALLSRLGAGRFRAYSAGSRPAGRVHPLALELLAALGHPIGELRSKHWEEFAGPDAPELHFIFTVCDHAASEACPVWPGRPASAHWGIADPAAVAGDPARCRRAFEKAHAELTDRIGAFLRLDIERMSAQRLAAELARIGREGLVLPD